MESVVPQYNTGVANDLKCGSYCRSGQHVQVERIFKWLLPKSLKGDMFRNTSVRGGSVNASESS